MKPDTALLKDNVFYFPGFTNEIHYECELVVKIDRVGKHIDQAFARRGIWNLIRGFRRAIHEIGAGFDHFGEGLVAAPPNHHRQVLQGDRDADRENARDKGKSKRSEDDRGRVGDTGARCAVDARKQNDRADAA